MRPLRKLELEQKWKPGVRISGGKFLRFWAHSSRAIFPFPKIPLFNPPKTSGDLFHGYLSSQLGFL
jgi:hypothetical protein